MSTIPSGTWGSSPSATWGSSVISGTTAPVGPGSQRRQRTGRAAALLPTAITVALLVRRFPWPSPRPVQAASSTRNNRSGPSQALSPASTTRTARRSRARAARFRAMAGRAGKGRRSSTTSTPSRAVETTPAQLCPGRGTMATCSRSTPSSDIATTPASSSPTATHQDPAVVAAATSAIDKVVAPPGPDPPELPGPLSGRTALAAPVSTRRTVPRSKPPARKQGSKRVRYGKELGTARRGR